MNTFLKILWMEMALCCCVSANSFMFTFDEYENGSIDGQSGWLNSAPGLNQPGFTVMGGLGRSGAAGDKALGISGADKYCILKQTESVLWQPDQTLTVSFDFRIGLVGGENKSGHLFHFSFGGDKDTERWAVLFEHREDGIWNIKANMPNWWGKDYPPETFVVRPATGMAVSKWFHLTMTSLKTEIPGVFKSTLKIENEAGNTVDEIVFTEKATPESGVLWNREEFPFYFTIDSGVNGLCCLDNLLIQTTPEK